MADIDEIAAQLAVEPWQPQVGDRVRIRLSGECSYRTATVTLPDGSLGGPVIRVPRHDPAIDGEMGTVIHVHSKAVRHLHRYTVRLDNPTLPSRNYFMSPLDSPGVDGLAAAELELLTGIYLDASVYDV